MVVAGGYLYFLGATNATPCTASYITNNVMFGFSNAGWSSWAPVPGNGAFKYPPSATAFQGNGGFFVVGVGTDGQAYAQAYNSAGWNNYWWLVSGGETFNASIWTTTFSAFGNDLEVFGLAPNDTQVEGDLSYTNPSGFNGWSSYGSTIFFKPFTATSPGASAPVPGHVDLAVNGGSRIYFSEYNN